MSIETEEELKALKRVGRVVRLALAAMERRVRLGVTTAELDAAAAQVFADHGAQSAPQVVYGFPGTACISVNDEVVHGVPGSRVLAAGDLVKLDVTAVRDGFMADAAITVAVSPAPEERRRLAACAKAAFNQAMAVARAGNRVRDIGRAVEEEVLRQGFAVVPGLAGHGIGRTIHEEPTVPNQFDVRNNRVLTEGLVITVEPIIAQGSGEAEEGDDGWTVRTLDGGMAAHYEHTLVITRGRPILLTAA